MSCREVLQFILQDDDDDIVNSWTLRKCSAAGLDVMSSFFGDEMLPILMPKLQVRLNHSAINECYEMISRKWMLLLTELSILSNEIPNLISLIWYCFR